MEPSDQTIFFKIFKNYNYNVINKLPLPPVSSVYNGHVKGGGELLLFSWFAGVEPVMQNLFGFWCLEFGISVHRVNHGETRLHLRFGSDGL